MIRDNYDYAQLGERLRQKRREANLSQARLASYLDKLAVTISDYERGRVAISVSTLVMICTILQCDISEMISPTIPFELPVPRRVGRPRGASKIKRPDWLETFN